MSTPPTETNSPEVTEWLTAWEAAQHLKVNPRTLLLWVRQGKVKGYKLSGTKRHVWRFLRTDLDTTLLKSQYPLCQLIIRCLYAVNQWPDSALPPVRTGAERFKDQTEP
jgi:excisionase family DNA binding protein